MAQAQLGDDGRGEDPTVNELEGMAAARFGKEAALFVASGTMGNFLSILAQSQRGDEIVVGDMSHVFLDELGGAASLGGVQVRPVRTDKNGSFDPDEVDATIRKGAKQEPRTSLVCIENTHNRSGGRVLNEQDIKGVADVAHRRGARLHIDGARIFNASVALSVPPAALARHADTVSFCLSKGLCCPAGALLCGSTSIVDLARRYRKMIGGTMRQSGFLAAAGILALDSLVGRLAEDHERARHLAQGLSTVAGVRLDDLPITNIVKFNLPGTPTHDLIGRLANQGILASSYGDDAVRMVTHAGISKEDVEDAVAAVRLLAA